jgi:uncharacterized surface protein with fasciclin (FAS1) repeats
MTAHRRRRIAAVSLAAALGLSLSACGGDDTTPTAGTAPTTAPSSSSPMTSESPSSSPSGSTGAASGKQFGAGCAAVPTTGPGSFEGMSADPVATAASNNPALSTLVTAVKAAGLVDTLNTAQDITVFAPTNDAFKAMDQATLKKALADPKGLLTKVLTYHVVPGKLSPEQLAGTHKTLQGGMVKVAGSGEDFTVGASDAKVVCGNVMTANATVYLIDGVLMPTA